MALLRIGDSFHQVLYGNAIRPDISRRLARVHDRGRQVDGDDAERDDLMYGRAAPRNAQRIRTEDRQSDQGERQIVIGNVISDWEKREKQSQEPTEAEERQNVPTFQAKESESQY